MNFIPKLRIDKWLWYARVMKTRSLSSKLIQAGHVRVNKEKVTTTSYGVKIGDVLTIAVHDRIRVLKVLKLGDRRGPASEAMLLYEDLSPPEKVSGKGESPDGTPSPERRPDKRERRNIEAFKSGFR